MVGTKRNPEPSCRVQAFENIPINTAGEARRSANDVRLCSRILVRMAALLEQGRDPRDGDGIGNGDVAGPHALHLTRRQREKRRVRLRRGRGVRRLLHVRRQFVHVEAAGTQQNGGRRTQQGSPEAVERRGHRAGPLRGHQQGRDADRHHCGEGRAGRPHPRPAPSGWGQLRYSRRRYGRDAVLARVGRGITPGRQIDAQLRVVGFLTVGTARGDAGLHRLSRGRWDRRQCRTKAPVRRPGHQGSAPSVAQETRSTSARRPARETAGSACSSGKMDFR